MTSRGRAKIGMWTTPEKKEQFSALAKARGMSETALLEVLVDHVLGTNPSSEAAVSEADRSTDEGASTERVTLRLRPGDRPLVEQRAAARNMKAATYLVALIRSHVRGQAPLPTTELNQLKASVGELSAVGRNLNQIARVVNSTKDNGSLNSLAEELKSAVLCVEEVRRSVAELVRVNLISWESEDA